MRRMSTCWFMLLLGAVITALACSSSAMAGCSLYDAGSGDIPVGTVVTSSVTASPASIRMPKDIAVGSELYRITLRESTYATYRVGCDGNQTATNYYTKGRFIGGVEPTRSGWQGSTLGVVYNTGTTGIGIVVLTSNTNKKMGEKYYFRTSTSYCYSSACGTPATDADITIVLLKTAEIAATSVSLSSLPKLESITGGDNSSGTEITIFQPTLTGSIAFTQATCTLSETSKTVKLGNYTLADFDASNASTAWVDASIKLINCNYGGAQNYKYNITRYSNSNTVTTNSNPNTANATWNLTLTPSTSIIDDAKGIMAIDSGAGSASGVGIQLSSTNTALNAMRFSQVNTGTLVSSTNATMTIPLFVRYIKTGTEVTAGNANGKLTYLIEYK